MSLASDLKHCAVRSSCNDRGVRCSRFEEVSRLESQHDGRPMLTLVYRRRDGGEKNGGETAGESAGLCWEFCRGVVLQWCREVDKGGHRMICALVPFIGHYVYRYPSLYSYGIACLTGRGVCVGGQTLRTGKSYDIASARNLSGRVWRTACATRHS